MLAKRLCIIGNRKGRENESKFPFLVPVNQTLSLNYFGVIQFTEVTRSR